MGNAEVLQHSFLTVARMLKRPVGYHNGVSRLVFAGQEKTDAYAQVSVKYETNSGFSSKYARNPRRLEIRLPDRTLFLFSKSVRGHTLLDVGADAAVSLRRDVSQLRALGVDMILMNHLNASPSLDTRSYATAGIDVMFDSGGFQLLQGSSDFVSPADVVAVYNKLATIGVGLDFPAPPFVDTLLYKENTSLQVLNNEFMRRRLASHVSLAPVIHGSTPRTRKWCMDAVVSKGDKAVCVSGLSVRTTDKETAVLQKFACLALVLDRLPPSVEYVHVLGATSSLWLALNAYLSQSGYVRSIGGDSVSYRQNALSGSYITYPHFKGALTLSQPAATHAPAALPCACPVCSIVGDARVLRDYRSSEVHHMWSAAVHKRVICDAMTSYLAKDLSRTELWHIVLGDGQRHARLHQTADKVLRYFEAVVAKGYKNVPPLAPFDGFSASYTQGLFGAHAGPSQRGAAQTLARYRQVHRNYEDFHGTRLV